jgi:hypothetical protein
MSARSAAIGVVLAVLGLAAAVGIGLAANSISDDSVGLSAQPLSAGNTLAPKSPAHKAKSRPRRHTERGERTDTAPAQTPTTSTPASPQDDHGGSGGRSDDGSGSSGSGSGSDSGSSGSGSSGSGDSGGSDDNPSGDDD